MPMAIRSQRVIRSLRTGWAAAGAVAMWCSCWLSRIGRWTSISHLSPEFGEKSKCRNKTYQSGVPGRVTFRQNPSSRSSPQLSSR